ncbi:glutaminyl-peptide cyclotransferase-like isoform X2 [Daphnia pulex]|uniref:glutaminyl-peptide cyclotransferase-like isoform X2 n=1 Tax=Daphnia pulex TaxID=6669 RepID=UPI001EDD169C|nr:glutaminyl-peptide cyclotransferase-like isoform X2 [Daphnia pulex]XP_046443087.1 glutaminyl-peptide cyclotransferase-like isoform X2 [Daphnia pulex]
MLVHTNKMISLKGVLFLLSLFSQSQSQAWFHAKSSHQANLLNLDQLKYVSGLSDMQRFDVTVDPILVPRVVGTPNHARVRQYIMDQMQSLGWDVGTDKFTADTPRPHGKKTFENIITTLDSNAQRRLVLACHYDSKYTRDGNFIGATDSAVPCAMMITLAKDLAPKLDQLKKSNSQVTLQFIFFDGEEAFKDWNSRDSIYGARNLARKWESTSYPAQNRDGTNELHRMDLMVLLDLLGARNPNFYSYITSGDRWFQHSANIEQRLRGANLLSTNNQIFRNDFAPGGIEDDHIPFMQRKVPILHLITTPFPDVWHTNGDNKSVLDYNTIDDLMKILRVFVVEYLQVNV